MRFVWSEAEIDFIKANAAIMKDTDIALTLTRLTGRNVTLYAVRHIRQSLGIKKRMGRGVCEVMKPGKVRSQDGASLLISGES
jgi:hypothetical protein